MWKPPGTVELEAPLVELACLISDPGAPRQNVHVDTGGWKTACAPLLSVFVSLQETAEDMGPTMLWRDVGMVMDGVGVGLVEDCGS
jgi:hypothetical protein